MMWMEKLAVWHGEIPHVGRSVSVESVDSVTHMFHLSVVMMPLDYLFGVDAKKKLLKIL